MNSAINLDYYFAKFTDTWSPKIVGELNGQHIKIVKLEGDKCPWHSHEKEDEMFWVIEGLLEIHLRSQLVTLKAGEFYIVPRGTEHRVIPKKYTRIVLFEPCATAHTGSVQAEITKKEYDRLI